MRERGSRNSPSKHETTDDELSHVVGGGDDEGSRDDDASSTEHTYRKKGREGEIRTQTGKGV